MGRHRKPVEIKLLEGTYRKDEHGDLRMIPQPTRLATQPAPDHLGPLGKKYWNEFFDELAGLGLLTVVDLAQFESLCILLDKIAECEKVMEKEGAWYQSGKGTILRHPAALQRDRYVAEKLTYIRQFGMTPSSRSGLQIKQETKNNGIQIRKRG